MSSSYIERGGMVGTNNPKDSNLRMQFWNGQSTVDGEVRRRRREEETWHQMLDFDLSLTPAIFVDAEEKTESKYPLHLVEEGPEATIEKAA